MSAASVLGHAALLLGRHLGRHLYRLGRHRRGSVAVEYAMILPAFLTLSLGTLEFALVLFDYHTLTEATRRGVRQAIIEDPIPSLANLSSGPITCTGSAAGTAVTCGATSVAAAASFTDILAAMREMEPDLAGSNVTVTYTNSSLTGDATTPGIATPVITVSIAGMTHSYLVLQGVPGLGTGYTFPTFATSAIGPSGAFP